MINVLLLLAISATGFGDQYSSGQKPGVCPRNDIITDCSCPPGPPRCTNDYDCPHNLKCCSFGCGCRNECRPPVFSPGPGTGCFYNGRYYNQGQSFPAGDGCNTCTCGGNGFVQCTLVFCGKIAYVFQGCILLASTYI